MARKLNVHISALTSQPEVFWVTEKRVADACKRHRAAAKQLNFDWSWDHDRFESGVADADMMIGWRFPRDDFDSKAPNVRLIQLTGAGTEHLQPFDWVPNGVSVVNNSGVHAEKAAEFAATAVLMLGHGVPFMATKQRERRWEKRFTTRVEGGTAVIVGMGGMGGATARWLKQRLKMTVIGVTRSGKPHRYADKVVRTGRLDSVLPKADVVVVMAPLTAQTEGLLDQRRLSLIKPGAGLLNMGRARIVDYDALRAALESGHLSGAVLDVFDPEPLPRSSPLWKTPNLILTPHCSSDDAQDYIPRTLDMFFDNVARYLAGKPLRNRIDTRLQY